MGETRAISSTANYLTSPLLTAFGPFCLNFQQCILHCGMHAYGQTAAWRRVSRRVA